MDGTGTWQGRERNSVGRRANSAPEGPQRATKQTGVEAPFVFLLLSETYFTGLPRSSVQDSASYVAKTESVLSLGGRTVMPGPHQPQTANDLAGSGCLQALSRGTHCTGPLSCYPVRRLQRRTDGCYRPGRKAAQDGRLERCRWKVGILYVKLGIQVLVG